MSDDDFNFGVQKPCTPEQLKEEIKELYAKCSLKSFGTFYFTYGEESKTRKGRLLVYVNFYDEKKQVLHTSPGGVFNSSGGSKNVVELTAINECTFVFGPFTDGSHVLLLSPDWSHHNFICTKENRKRSHYSLETSMVLLFCRSRIQHERSRKEEYEAFVLHIHLGGDC